MPTARHFIKRHAWHDFLLLLVISHSLLAGQLYSILPGRGRGREGREERKGIQLENEEMKVSKRKEKRQVE